MIVKETKNTHEKVRDFQNRLYLTAKTSKKRRFHAMYDKIYRKDILEEAWKRVKTNGGAGGIDKVSIDDVKAYGEEKLLDEKELKILNNLVSGFFDFAEIQAIEHVPMYMSDYIEQLDRILSSNKRKLLEDSGSISHRQAIEKAENEYRRYQENTLSPVEKAYLNTLREAEKEAKKKRV